MESEKLLILLVEDDEIDREQVRRLLGNTYTLQMAATGKAATAALETERPDLILLDYGLPDVDSFDLLGQLVAAGHPVIVLTGEERPDIIVGAMQKGAQDYLLKGQLSQVTLERAIVNALEKAALKRSVIAQQEQIALQAEALVEQNQQIRTLASALTLAEQRERKRIAQILHDHVQQLLYGVQMRMHLLTEDMPADASPPLHENLAEATALLEDAIGAARSLSVDLSPPVLKDEGIGVALQWLAAHMERIHGLHVNLQISIASDYRFKDEDLHILIFQLVRELLFNVVKHANVKEARLHLYSEGDHQKILVEDEGVGFEMGHIVQPKWKPEQGYGLYSVRERLALFGGRMDIDAHPGNGARIIITLPEAWQPE